MQQIEQEFNEILNNIQKTRIEINKLYELEYKLLDEKKQIINNYYKYKFIINLQKLNDSDKFKKIFENIESYKIGNVCFWFEQFYYTNNILDVIAMYSNVSHIIIEFFDVENKYDSIVFGVDADCKNVLIISKSHDIKQSIPMELFNKLIQSGDRYKIFDLLISGEFELGLILLKNL